MKAAKKDREYTAEMVALSRDLLPFYVRINASDDPAFVKRFGKRVKDAGGTYTSARGRQEIRYVTLPIAQTALIDEIWVEFAKVERFSGINGDKMGVAVITMEGFNNLPAWVYVHEYPHSCPNLSTQIRLDFAYQIVNARVRNQQDNSISSSLRPCTRTEKLADEAKRFADSVAVAQRKKKEATDAVEVIAALLAQPGGKEALADAINGESYGEDFLRLAQWASQALANKATFTPYPSDCGECHGKAKSPSNCICGGTGEQPT